MFVRDSENEIFADMHPCHEQLSPSDVLEALRLTTEWMNKGL